MYYLINALLGAAVAVGIAYISRTSAYFLAGLLPFFPTFTLFAHIAAYNAGGVGQVRQVAIFGIIAFIPALAYILTVIFAMPYMKFWVAVCVALAVWSAAAILVIYGWKAGYFNFLLTLPD